MTTLNITTRTESIPATALIAGDIIHYRYPGDAADTRLCVEKHAVIAVAILGCCGRARHVGRAGAGCIAALHSVQPR